MNGTLEMSKISSRVKVDVSFFMSSISSSEGIFIKNERDKEL